MGLSSFPDFTNNHHLTASILMEDPPMFERMSWLKTHGAFNFDEDTYTVFKPFFDKLLMERHGKITVNVLGRAEVGNYEIYYLKWYQSKIGS